MQKNYYSFLTHPDYFCSLFIYLARVNYHVDVSTDLLVSSISQVSYYPSLNKKKNEDRNISVGLSYRNI